MRSRHQISLHVCHKTNAIHKFKKPLKCINWRNIALPSSGVYTDDRSDILTPLLRKISTELEDTLGNSLNVGLRAGYLSVRTAGGTSDRQ